MGGMWVMSLPCACLGGMPLPGHHHSFLEEVGDLTPGLCFSCRTHGHLPAVPHVSPATSQKPLRSEQPWVFDEPLSQAPAQPAAPLLGGSVSTVCLCATRHGVDAVPAQLLAGPTREWLLCTVCRPVLPGSGKVPLSV